MARAEIVDRSPVEILLDHRRADVRGARNRGGVAELLADLPPHRGYRLPLRGRRLRQPALGERDGGDQRPAPRAEVLRAELVAHVPPDVVVELARVEWVDLAIALVPKDACRAVERHQLA